MSPEKNLDPIVTGVQAIELIACRCTEQGIPIPLLKLQFYRITIMRSLKPCGTVARSHLCDWYFHSVHDDELEPKLRFFFFRASCSCIQRTTICEPESV
jgi:hypothetical protein